VGKATKAPKTTKAAKAPKLSIRHTWRVTRRDNQTTDVSAESLTVVFGDLVFSTNGVVVRVIGVDTFNDVELVSP
jgi:hypothetical protein